MHRGFFSSVGRLALTVGLICCARPVLAHGVHVSAHVHDGMIHGEAHYPDDTPVRGATVTAYDPAGQQIDRTTIDQKGSFTLEAKFRCDHWLLVDTGDGHGAEYTVRAAQLPANLPPRGDATVAAVPEEDPLESIQKDLAELRDRLWLRDVLGGLGYIVGIAGVAFYFLGVRRKQSRHEG